MNKYGVEWWYAEGHGNSIIWADDEEDAERKFWKSFKRFLPMAYEKTEITLLEEDPG